MKEQWKNHDSDAKLLQNVEEGRPQPIKIELPISAYALKHDGCCSRLITLLRVAILFVLLIILSWTAVTLYSNYYPPQQLEIDEKTEKLVSNQHDYSNEENKLSFRNKVYAMSDRKDNVVLNEIDIPISVSTAASITTSNLLNQGGFNDDEVRAILEFLQKKNLEDVRVINIIPKQENGIKKDVQIIDVTSEPNQESHLANQNVFSDIPMAPIFNFQDISDVNLKNKMDDSEVNNQIYDKTFSFPDKRLDSDEKDSIELPNGKYISGEKDNKNFESDVKIEEDDVEDLFYGIANAMGLLDEPSSEINQSNEESVAVIGEEIKNNEENSKIRNLGKSTVLVIPKEQSIEESVNREEIIDPNEEAEPIEKSIAITQEEIKSNSKEYLAEPFLINENSDYNVPIEDDFSTEKSRETMNSEYSSIDDFDKNIGQHLFVPTINMLHSFLIHSETDVPMDSSILVAIENAAAILAKILEPLVGQNYELVHWYYNILMNANFGDLFDDETLVYAAKVLYNQDINYYNSDMEMFLNVISKNSYYSGPYDLMNPQKQVLADTFLQKQIVDKLLMKLSLKRQYDSHMVTFTEVWQKIDESNSNHVKSWLVATHPSVYEKNLQIVSLMNYRRAFYPMIKEDLLAVKNEFINEDHDLSLLNLSENDFDEEPKPSDYEKLLVLTSKSMQQLSPQMKLYKSADNIVDTKLTKDYVPDNVHESIARRILDTRQYLMQKFQQVNAMKEVGKEFDYSDEKVLEMTEPPQERMGEDSNFNDSTANGKLGEDNGSNDSTSNEKSVLHFTINLKFIHFLSKKLESIVGPHFDLIDSYHNTYEPYDELEETQDNLSTYTGKLLFDTDIRMFFNTLNIVSRLVMNNSNTEEYEKIIADDLDLTPETEIQSYIFDILNKKLELYNIWENQGNTVLNDISFINQDTNDSIYLFYFNAAKKIGAKSSSFGWSAQSSSEESALKNQEMVQAIKEIGKEYEQTNESAEETTVSILKNHDDIEESFKDTASMLKSHDSEETVDETTTKESVEETTVSVVKNHDSEESVEETTVSVEKNYDSEESIEETTVSVVKSYDDIDVDHNLKEKIEEIRLAIESSTEPVENFEEGEVYQSKSIYSGSN